VRAGAADAEGFRIGEGGRRVGGDEFVGGQGLSLDSGFSTRCLNVKVYGEEKFVANRDKKSAQEV
jgi:hypothetical protein